MKKCKFCDSGIDGSSSSGRKYYGKQLESIEFCSNKCAIRSRSSENNSNEYIDNHDGTTTLRTRV